MPSTKTYKFTVDDSHKHQRLDRFLSQKLSRYSRSFLKKLIDQNLVRVNDQEVKPSYSVEIKDQITIEIPEPEQTQLAPEKIPLDIIYEDEYLLVVNKPTGMVVHPGAGVRDGTLVNALLYHCEDLSGIGGRLRPGIVHRLDKHTSGLLVVAKEDRTHRDLQTQFAQKTAHREYRVLVWGNLQSSKGQIETFLNRSKSDRKKFAVSPSGKPALTLYEVEKFYSFLTLAKVWLKTGRSHQIRVHFKHLNHPVFGDPDYSGRNKQIKQISNLSQRKFALNLLSHIDRQALHAFTLGFMHPIKKRTMNFSTPLPADFQNILDQLEKIEGSS
jgi:23S rRNA pseudouridine1911/1915/1917 synthase